MWLKTRSNEIEWIDEWLHHTSLEEYYDALHNLGKIGRLLGGDRVIYKELKRLSNPPKSIIDVGCGGGHLVLRLAYSFPKTQIIGLEIDPQAIAFANKEHGVLPKNLHFILIDKEDLLEHLKNHSVILSSLVCHHLSDNELIEFISKASQCATQAVILNDLHRHYLAYISYRFIAPLMFQNRMITHDGLISIKRSFHNSDWQRLLKRANVSKKKYTLRWYFAFRWGVHIRCQ